MEKIGDGQHAKKSALCPFHEDKHASFSIFQKNGGWLWKCHAGCSHGDGVTYLEKRFGLSRGEAIARYCREAGLHGPMETPANAGDTFDWRQCVSALTAEAKRQLADWRGYSPDFVDWLHREKFVGIQAGDIAFAVHKAGRVVGCHYLANRAKKLWKYHPAGNGVQPLIFGDPGNAARVFCFESQWDAFAIMDKLGWQSTAPNDDAVFITRGSENGRLIKGRCPPDSIVYAFIQNDTPKSDGSKAAEKWLSDIASFAGCKVLRVATPAEFKDANDWARGGAGKAEIEIAISEAKVVAAPDSADTAPDATKEIPPPVACPLSALVHPAQDDASELLRRRFLCRWAWLLLCGPTGIGKSSLAMQAAILWALGRACFGMEPTSPLKSLVVQAENDAGDLAEMRDGIIRGIDLTANEAKTACENVLICREDEFCGAAFWGRVRLLLAKHKPDMLWIDPALAYIGGEANSQRDVGGFLRNGLNPLLREFNCSAVVIHHTNKPPSGRDRPTWAAGEFAYLGAGSAEWANTARAVLALRSIGSHDCFELHAAKRGARLSWQDDQGHRSFVKYLAHAKEPGVICWRETGPEEIQATGGRPKVDVAELIALLPPEGLATGDWVNLAKAECGVSEATLHRVRRELVKAGRIAKSSTSGKWQPVTKR